MPAEAELYPIVRNWIDAEFPSVRAGARIASHRKTLVTADLDWIDGGQWMRPDLALVHVHRRRFDPTPAVDLYTFEIKPPGSQALSGLHQTLAHGRIGDFVVFILPNEASVGREVEAQASRFGVGLVTFDQAKVWASYKIRTSPQRMSPDPDLRDQFLTRALDADGTTAEVLGWIRGDEQQ
jgi:hypothetical protein